MERDGEVSPLLAFGARVLLEAVPGDWPLLAQCCGIELQPGEDLLTAMGRAKGVDRDQVESYFRALAEGTSIEASHAIAAPAAGPVQ
jgi:hypothetical protein